MPAEKAAGWDRDKSLLDWHGRTLLEHMSALLRTVADDVRIVGRTELPDNPAGLGPIGGLVTALRSSPNENNILVAVDLPLLTKEFMKYFKERFDNAHSPLTVCKIGPRFPLCIGVRRSLQRTLEDYIASGQRSLHRWIEQIPCEIITTGDIGGAEQASILFTNINTETDYETALTAINRDNS